MSYHYASHPSSSSSSKANPNSSRKQGAYLAGGQPRSNTHPGAAPGNNFAGSAGLGGYPAAIASLDFQTFDRRDDAEVAPPPRLSSYKGSSSGGRERSATITPQSVAGAGTGDSQSNRLAAHKQQASRSHHNLRGVAQSGGTSTSGGAKANGFGGKGNGALGRTASDTLPPLSLTYSTTMDSSTSSLANNKSPTPTAPNSRSRSGSLSSSRYLSLNTGSSSVSPSPSVSDLGGGADPAPTSPVFERVGSQSASASQSPASSTSPPSAGSNMFGTQPGREREKDGHISRKSSSRTVGNNAPGITTNGSGSSSSSGAGAGQRKTSSATVRPSGSGLDLTNMSIKEESIKEGGRSREKSFSQQKENKDSKDKEKEKAVARRNGRSSTPFHAGSSSMNGVQEEETNGYRRYPRLHVHDALPAPPTLMYWSKAPVWGQLPTHKMRSHSATVVDSNMIWLFGGCDDKSFWRDVWCLDVETMEWTRPETTGDIPPPCRAHTATLVDRKIFVFGGGQGNMYYNKLYILDTVSRRWTQVAFNSPPAVGTSSSGHSHTLSVTEEDASPHLGANPTASPSLVPAPLVPSPAPSPAIEEHAPRPRRAHTTVLYKNRLVVFGGGNGATALNDVWVLEVVGVQPERMRWQRQRTTGAKPSPRGYHTANLVGNVMIVVGGSDGKQTFSDIFCLNLDTFHWSTVRAERPYRRLAHTSTQIGSYLFIVGGHDGSQYTNDLLLFNLVSLQYEPRLTRGPLPSARGYHSSVLADGRLWLFGGYDARTAHDDVHILELASSAYLSQVTGFYVNV